MNVDVNSLTLGEIAAIENLSGLAIDQLGDAGIPKGKMYAAIAFVIKKRHNPTFTFEDALALDMNELSGLFGTDDADPKDKN